jgi:hypothetical protein
VHARDPLPFIEGGRQVCSHKLNPMVIEISFGTNHAERWRACKAPFGFLVIPIFIRTERSARIVAHNDLIVARKQPRSAKQLLFH